MNKCVIFFIIFLLFNVGVLFGEAAYRFPHPEFTTDYTVPESTFQNEISFITDYIKTVLILLFLIAGYWAIYKKRSRIYIFILTILNLIIFGFWLKGCICPIGLIQNISDAVFNNTAISIWYALIFILPLFFAAFAGRIFCSTACPLGALQELIFLKEIRVHFVVDKILKFIPYFVLGISIVLAASQAGYFVCRLDPFVAIFRRTALFQFVPLTVIFLLLSLFFSRPYCKYFCPYGVLLKLFSYLSGKKIEITKDNCINCKLCEKSCPYGAIIPSAPTTKPEPYKTGLSRIKKIIMIIPLVLIIASITGFYLGKITAYYHPDVKLYRDIQDENKFSEPHVEGFLMTGISQEKLFNKAERNSRIIINGFSISFIFIFLLIMIDIILYSKLQNNKEPYIEISDCYTCGRCYDYCPINKTKDN